MLFVLGCSQNGKKLIVPACSHLAWRLATCRCANMRWSGAVEVGAAVASAFAREISSFEKVLSLDSLKQRVTTYVRIRKRLTCLNVAEAAWRVVKMLQAGRSAAAKKTSAMQSFVSGWHVLRRVRSLRASPCCPISVLVRECNLRQSVPLAPFCLSTWGSTQQCCVTCCLPSPGHI